MERRNTVFLTIIAVATLLVAVIGATFAYFSVQITGNDTATSTIIKTANIKITYTAGDSIVGENIEPGWTDSLTFTVANEGDRELEYYIKWVDVTNNFSQDADKVNELIYTVSCQSGLTCGKTQAATPAPTADGYIGSSVTIPAKTTHSYVIDMEFVETSSEQNYNQGKSFSGAINIELTGTTIFSTDDVYSGN